MAAEKKILFVTNVNLASNPRCLKEVRAVLEAGYEATVLKFVIDNWSAEYEAIIEKELPQVEWITINVGRKPFMPWFLSALASYIAKLELNLFGDNPKLISYFLDKRSFLINKKLNTINKDYHIVIAHNPGAFWASSRFAAKHNIPLGIDVEDYHPGEYKDAKRSGYMTKMMNKVLFGASYITAASPLILQYATRGISNTKAKQQLINNVFSLKHQPAFNDLPINSGVPLKLFWFSQFLGTDRGLQDVISAMNLIDDFSVQLTLMGNSSESLKTELLSILTNNKHSIVFKNARPEKELITESANHHIGLALENGANLNRDLCLTNKLFTYLLAGNAIVASDTNAQKLFMDENPQVGDMYNAGDSDMLAGVLKGLYNNEALLAKRKVSYQLAKDKYNWGKEKQTFLQLVKETIDTHAA